MTIIKEIYTTREDGVKLYKTYSTDGYLIKQNETGDIYDEAIDVENTNFTYTETDNKIETNIQESQPQE